MKKLAKTVAVDFEVRLSIKDDELLDILNRTIMMVYTPSLEPDMVLVYQI